MTRAESAILDFRLAGTIPGDLSLVPELRALCADARTRHEATLPHLTFLRTALTEYAQSINILIESIERRASPS